MKKSSFDAIVRALNDAQVPFLVVGGVAVISHGYGRVTQDIDLVVRLEQEVIRRAFRALEGIGYKPAVPISAEEFADANQRESWRVEKGMKVLKFWSDQHRDTPLDVFVSEPFDFMREYAAAETRETAPGIAVRIVSLPTLLTMKREAGRPKDLADIDELNLLYGNPPAMTSKPKPAVDWSQTTWKGSRLQQHREFLSLSFARKLEVMDEIQETAESFQLPRPAKNRPPVTKT